MATTIPALVLALMLNHAKVKILTRIIHGGDWIFARRTVPAGLTAIFEAGFQNGLEVEVRGSSGNACRVVQGPWAAIRPAIEIMALR